MSNEMKLSRRATFLGAGALALSAALPSHATETAAPPRTDALPAMEVVKTPSCGCCTAWIDMARTAGFEVTVTDTRDYAGMKKDAGVPPRLASCHTARIGGYVVEGHVPFAAIHALLRDRPDVTGISVPGMPAASPGMGGGLDAVVPVTAWGGAAGDGQDFAFAAK